MLNVSVKIEAKRSGPSGDILWKRIMQPDLQKGFWAPQLKKQMLNCLK